MEKNEKNLTDGQEIATEIIGEVAGIGAGSLVGGLALAVVQAAPMGKLLKVVCAVGSIGITWAVQNWVGDETKKTMTDIFDGVNAIKGMFGGKVQAVEKTDDEKLVVIK